MIRSIRIENYKSIPDLALQLGRVNVLIGANGSGKTNILEAIALASAAAQDKLDNEFLNARGIRVTEARFMYSGFAGASKSAEYYRCFRQGDKKLTTERCSSDMVEMSIAGDHESDLQFRLFADEKASYPRWRQIPSISGSEFISGTEFQSVEESLHHVLNRLSEFIHNSTVSKLFGFLIFSPENSVLRTFQSEGQILPLGGRGEGLFAHLKALNTKQHKKRLVKIRETLSLIDWFETFEIPEDLRPEERAIRIQDRHLSDTVRFDQRSANEGFLFLLFYITLLVSPETPAFFAIDNIDTSLNPKLCIALLQKLAILAKEYDKQVILTTHNPAVLDGLDLNDEEQRLIVVDRNKEGHTRVHRVNPPKQMNGSLPVSLSEAFMRGYIGGLPKNF